MTEFNTTGDILAQASMRGTIRHGLASRSGCWSNMSVCMPVVIHPSLTGSGQPLSMLDAGLARPAWLCCHAASPPLISCPCPGRPSSWMYNNTLMACCKSTLLHLPSTPPSYSMGAYHHHCPLHWSCPGQPRGLSPTIWSHSDLWMVLTQNTSNDPSMPSFAGSLFS